MCVCVSVCVCVCVRVCACVGVLIDFICDESGSVCAGGGGGRRD